MVLIQNDFSISALYFVVRKREVVSVRLDTRHLGPGLLIRQGLGVAHPLSSTSTCPGPAAAAGPILAAGAVLGPRLRLLLPVDGRRVGGAARGRVWRLEAAGHWRRWQRVESVPGRTSAQADFIFLGLLVVEVDLLGQLAEDVVDLLVDGGVAAPELGPHPVLAAAGPASAVVSLGLCAGGQTLVKLSDNSVQQVQAAPDIVTARGKNVCLWTFSYIHTIVH